MLARLILRHLHRSRGAFRRGHSNHFESGFWTTVQHLGQNRIKVVGILHVRAIKADHHQRRAARQFARHSNRCRCRHRRIDAGQGRGKATSKQLTVLDGVRQRGQIRPLIGKVAGLARRVGPKLREQPIDQHNRLTGLVLQHFQLRVVLVNSARQTKGRLSCFQQIVRGRGIPCNLCRQRCHIVDIARHQIQLALRFIPLLDQTRIARCRAHL